MNYNNLAERTNFIAGSSAFKHIPFFISSITIPEISIEHPEVSGGRFSHNLKLAGDTIKYGTLSFEMLIDENLLIYDEIYNLIKSNTNPDNGTFGDFMFDFFVEMNDNKGHSVLVFNFDNCRISSVGSLNLETSDDSVYYRLSMELVFDKFYPVRQRSFKQTGEFDIIRHRKPKIFEDSWTSVFDLNEYVLWGLPPPMKIHSTDMVEMISMAHPGNSDYESGMVLRKGFDAKEGVEIEVMFDSEFDGEFDDSDSGIKFGLTEGSGIRSSINGRTGKSLFEVTPNTSVYNIKYLPNGPDVEININGESYKLDPSNHSELFLFFQGVEGTNIKSIKYRLN